MSNRIYGYIRVSSEEQNIDRQLQALLDNNVDERYIFIDKESGKDFNREQYQIMKHGLRENDLLIIKSIDRLGRNYNMIISEWRDITLNIKADIRVLDMELLDTTKHKDLLGTFISDLILQVLSYVSEQERAFIKQRQKEGISIAKTKGIKFGRPKIQKPENFKEVVGKWHNKEITARQAMKELNLKANTFYNLVKKDT